MQKKHLLGMVMILLLIATFLRIDVTVIAAQRIDKLVTATSGDTAKQLQELLNHNQNGQYNLTVQIPAGDYILEKELLIYSNTTIVADKKAKLLKNHQRGAMIANDLSTDKGGYATSENIQIIGGIWDSSKIADEDKGTESLRFIHATNITIKDATICNVPNGSHLVTFAGVKNGVLSNCILYGYGGNMEKEAVHLDIVHDDEMIYTMQKESLVFDDLPCDGITITNCEIYDYSRGVGTHTSVAGVYHKNIVIDHNYFHDLDEAAVKAYQYVNLDINHNTIERVGLGILVYTYIANEDNHYKEALATTKKEATPKDYGILISHNNIKNILEAKTATKWGDGIRIIGSKERPMKGVVLKNNTITNTKRYGIFMESAPDCTITDNTIDATSTTGIYLIEGSNDSSVIGNTVTNAGKTDKTAGAIGVLSSNAVEITSNVIKSPAKNGIFLYVKSASCVIHNNTITLSGENGISINQQSNDTIVTNNKISTYKKNGIFIYEVGSATVTGNRITAKVGNKSSDGLQIIGDNSSNHVFTIKSNTILSSNRYGMYINNTPKSYIASNTIENTVKHALYLDGGSSNSKIYYNKITNGGKAGSTEGGIGISKSNKVIIYKNTVKNAAKNGIFLYNQSTNCTIKENTITGASDNAISVNNKSNFATITGNKITGNTQKSSNNRGIFVYQSTKYSISKNIITNCEIDQKIIE